MTARSRKNASTPTDATTTPAPAPRPRRRTRATPDTATHASAAAIDAAIAAGEAIVAEQADPAATQPGPVAADPVFANVPKPQPRKSAAKAPAVEAPAAEAEPVTSANQDGTWTKPGAELVPVRKPRASRAKTAAKADAEPQPEPQPQPQEPPFAVGDFAKPIEAQHADELAPGVVTEVTETEGAWMVEVSWPTRERLLLATELEPVDKEAAELLLAQPVFTVVGMIDLEANDGEGQLHIAGAFMGVPFGKADGLEIEGNYVAMPFDTVETLDGRWYRFAHRVYAATGDIAIEQAMNYDEAFHTAAGTTA